MSNVLGNLHALRSLRTVLLVHCNLAAVPLGLCRLSQLQVLSLNDNPIADLPEAMRNLCRLRELNLGSIRRLRALPAWFGSFAQLTRLDISHCTMLTSLATLRAGVQVDCYMSGLRHPGARVHRYISSIV